MNLLSDVAWCDRSHRLTADVKPIGISFRALVPALNPETDAYDAQANPVGVTP